MIRQVLYVVTHRYLLVIVLDITSIQCSLYNKLTIEIQIHRNLSDFIFFPYLLVIITIINLYVFKICMVCYLTAPMLDAFVMAR